MEISEDKLAVLIQHSNLLLELIERGFMDAPGIETATEEMIAAEDVPKGWTIYDVRPASHGLRWGKSAAVLETLEEMRVPLAPTQERR